MSSRFRFFNELEEWQSEVTHLIDKAEGQASGFEALPMPQGSHKIKDQLNRSIAALKAPMGLYKWA